MFTIFTEASTQGWGAHMGDSQILGTWTWSDCRLHINCLELKAVILALHHQVTVLLGHQVLIYGFKLRNSHQQSHSEPQVHPGGRSNSNSPLVAITTAVPTSAQSVWTTLASFRTSRTCCHNSGMSQMASHTVCMH